MSLISVLPFSLFVIPVFDIPSAITVALIGVVCSSSSLWDGRGPWLVLQWIGVVGSGVFSSDVLSSFGCVSSVVGFCSFQQKSNVFSSSILDVYIEVAQSIYPPC